MSMFHISFTGLFMNIDAFANIKRLSACYTVYKGVIIYQMNNKPADTA